MDTPEPGLAPDDDTVPASLQWPEGIDAHHFVSEFWQRQPLLVRQALPGFHSPLSPDELAGLALEEDTTPRLILRDERGRYHLEHGPFAADRFEALGTSDWSLLVTDVEKHLPALAAWLAPFRFLPAWRLDDLMISYAPDGASVGAHVDEYDVFLLQASGRRRWEIQSAGIDAASTESATGEPAAGGQSATRGDPETDADQLRLLDNFTPDQSWVLEPGDLLYLPPGVPHHGIAVGDDCMTWSIGFRAPAQRDIVEEFSALLADSLRHRRFEDPAFEPLQAAETAEISSVTILRFAELWADAVRLVPAQLQEFVGRLVTANPLQTGLLTDKESDLATGDLPALHAAPARSPDEARMNGTGAASQLSCTTWTRHPFSRFAFVNTGTGAPPDDAARLFVDGSVYDCSIAFARQLCDPGNPVLPAHLATDTRELELLTELARCGKIEPLAGS